MIRVLVVDDSPVAIQLLVRILDNDPELSVIGTVMNGRDAVDAVVRLQPDVITMDVHLPGIDGFEATRKIMELRPTPIIMVSASADTQDAAIGFRAMDSGAVTLLPRPPGPHAPDHAAATAGLLRMVKLMAEVKLVRRWARDRERGASAPISACSNSDAWPSQPIHLVAVGASTGGPPALKSLLAALPATFPVPMVIVQHIAPGFVPGLAEWLANASGFPVEVAGDRHALIAGHAYLAPDDKHLSVTSKLHTVLSDAPPDSGLRPSIAHLFRSVAAACGARAAGVLLTGMGKDGAIELKAMRDAGAVTFAQDRASCVVYGMPAEAMRLGAVLHTLSPVEIGNALVRLAAATKSVSYERS